MPSKALAGAFAGLAPPALRGWPRLQATLVDRIKRAALRQLHASAAGELLVLRIYLIGEVATEQALQREEIANRPDWLMRQMERHLAEEQGHARVLEAALAARGARPWAGEPDWFSRRKLASWHRLAKEYAAQFSHGLLVPAFAIGLCAEQMAMRVLQRHCAVIGPTHPMYPMLQRIENDERRHVRLCMGTLTRLVGVAEQPALAALLRDVRTVERSFGVSGALGLYVAGLTLRLRGRRP